MVEQLPVKELVVGSNPTCGARKKEGKILKKKYAEFFFMQMGPTCGVCVLNTVLKMFGKRGVIFNISYAPNKGVSPKRIMYELRRAGLDAISRKISIRSLKRGFILYYEPPIDHYVVVGEVKKEKILIYDSARYAPYWTTPSKLSEKWKGWAIKVTKPNGRG